MAEVLRKFDATRISEDCSDLTGLHDNELFFSCLFNKVNGLTLKNCDLNKSKFVTNNIRDAMGFTLTLDCHSFSGVDYSTLMFDLILVLLSTTSGNNGKREQLKSVVGLERYEQLRRILKALE